MYNSPQARKEGSSLLGINTAEGHISSNRSNSSYNERMSALRTKITRKNSIFQNPNEMEDQSSSESGSDHAQNESLLKGSMESSSPIVHSHTTKSFFCLPNRLEAIR
mmetsp:Transcript_25052/g.38880  ORF Transcript_25052/g.38880 Transcript_25052/m.38880 type:complete len:107 (-) Transcript_25052:3610-3930(-)